MDNKENQSKKHVARIVLSVISIVIFARAAFHIVRDQKRASDFDIVIEGIYNTYSSSQIESMSSELESKLGAEYYKSEDISKIPNTIVNVNYLSYVYEQNWMTLDCINSMKEYLPFFRLGLVSVYDGVYITPKITNKEIVSDSNEKIVTRFELQLKFFDAQSNKTVKYAIDTWCDVTKMLDNGEWKIDKIVMEDILSKWEGQK